MNDKQIIIAITGPESTGKSVLSGQLAAHYSAALVAEQSRKYLCELGRKWQYEDVLKIARLQLEEEQQVINSGVPLIFCDTELIAIKVWLAFYDYSVPEWVNEAIENTPIAHYLLMDIDLEWTADELRENPDDRHELLSMFQRELIAFNKSFTVVSGVGEERSANALAVIEQLLM